MIDYYQSQKQEKIKKRKAKILAFVILIVVVLVSGGLIYLFHSSYAKITGISVTFDPRDETLEKEVSDLAVNYFNNPSSVEKIIFGRDSILLAAEKRSRFEEDVLNKFPVLKNINMNIGLFSRTVSINAESRDKFGLWCYETPGNTDASSTQLVLTNIPQCYWFDSQGVAFLSGPDTEGQLIFKVIDNYDKPVMLGLKVTEDDYVQTLISMFNVLNFSGIGYKTLYMREPGLEEMSTDPSISPVFYFSLRNNPIYALRAFNQPGNKVLQSSVIDLRIPNRIYYK